MTEDTSCVIWICFGYHRLTHLSLACLKLDWVTVFVNFALQAILSKGVCEFLECFKFFDLGLHGVSLMLLVHSLLFAFEHHFFDASIQIYVLAESIQVVWAHFFNIKLDCSERGPEITLLCSELLLHSRIIRMVLVQWEWRLKSFNSKLEFPPLLYSLISFFVQLSLVLDNLCCLDNCFVCIVVPAIEFEHCCLLQMSKLHIVIVINLLLNWFIVFVYIHIHQLLVNLSHLLNVFPYVFVLIFLPCLFHRSIHFLLNLWLRQLVIFSVQTHVALHATIAVIKWTSVIEGFGFGSFSLALELFLGLSD